MKAEGHEHFVWDLKDNQFDKVTLFNSISFYIFNWVGLVILLFLAYRIRHTGDDTYLRLECIFIVGIWMLFSFPQYATFFYNYTISCRQSAQ